MDGVSLTPPASPKWIPRERTIVRPVHARALPVLLVPVETHDLTGSAEEAMTLQRPLPNEPVQIRRQKSQSGLVAASPTSEKLFTEAAGLGAPRPLFSIGSALTPRAA
jgi:hypothetical protein